MNTLALILSVIKAAFEGLKVALIYDAGKVRERLEAMEHEEKIRTNARDAMAGDRVSDDEDPRNRANK